MSKTFLFYDLETSGLNTRYQRIMQFAGQRTDMDLKPIGQPVNVLVQLTDDILPEPEAVLVTGITPQKTLQEGISEPELAKLLSEEVFTADTIVVGFNNLRFDDEFIRFCLWRNFYDPYEWAYSEGRSRWDILDVVRMTRALRPGGIEWPVDKKGEPTNKLEALSQANKLNLGNAHDALNDVMATIGMAQLIKNKQPKLFDYLLRLRDKKKIAELVNLDNPVPFVYSSGRYSKDHHFTSVALPIAPGSRPGSVLVYDLRHDPAILAKLSAKDLEKSLFASREERLRDDFQAVAVKELMYNKCPAVAPLGVVDGAAWHRLGLSQELIQKHLKSLNSNLADKISAAFASRMTYPKETDVEGQLYDSFGSDPDKKRLAVVRAANTKALADFHPEFVDERLPELLLRYKARHYPKSLSADEQLAWEKYRQIRFARDAPQFVEKLQRLAIKTQGDDNAQFVLEELRLWCENTIPIEI